MPRKLSRFFPPTEAALLHLLSADFDLVERLSLLIRHPLRTNPDRAELAVDIAKYLASNDRGFMPRGLVVGKFFAFLINAWAHTVHVEEVSRHYGVSIEGEGSAVLLADLSSLSIALWASAMDTTLLIDARARSNASADSVDSPFPTRWVGRLNHLIFCPSVLHAC
jgi:hypothetical protein